MNRMGMDLKKITREEPDKDHPSEQQETTVTDPFKL